MCLIVTIILFEILSLATANNYGTFMLSGSNLLWPSVKEESDDICFGRYEPRKILIHGIQMDNKRAYVAMPKFMKTGVPWTLGVFRLEVMDLEPDIHPYPDYNYYKSCNSDSTVKCLCIVNVIDIYLESGVLWVLDTGTTNILKKHLRLGPPQLIGINLTNDSVIRVVDLSPVTRADSALEYVVAQRTTCHQLFVFVSDATKHTILVYDLSANHLHTIPLPETIAVTLFRHVVLNLIPVGKCGKSYVYFTYRQSGNMYALESWSKESVMYGSVSEVGIKPVDMYLLGSDRGTNIYFRTGDGTDIWVWDVNRPLKLDSFVLVHRSYLYLLPTVVVAGWQNIVWTIESNYEEYINGNVDCTGPRTLLRPLKTVVENCDSFNEL